MAATPFSLEGLFAYISETFAAGVIQSYQGQGLLDDAPLLQRQDPMEDFKKFNRNDQIFQEYDPPSCLLYTSPSPRDGLLSRMPSSA